MFFFALILSPSCKTAVVDHLGIKAMFTISIKYDFDKFVSVTSLTVYLKSITERRCTLYILSLYSGITVYIVYKMLFDNLKKYGHSEKGDY